MHLPFGTGLYWRKDESIQIGFDPQRRAILTGLYPGEVPLLNLLRQPCTLTDVLAWARSNGVDPSRAEKIFRRVESTDLALDNDGSVRLTSCEYAAAGRAGMVDARKRADLGVRIRGAGLIGSILALLLDLEGIGAVQLADPLPLTADQSRWFSSTHIGQPIEQVVRARLRSAAQPERWMTASVTSRVIARDVAAGCLANGEPYLPIVVSESEIRLGPFFAPGGPCHNCLDLHATRADESWPLIATQAARLPGIEPDGASALMAASWACAEIVDYAVRGRPRMSERILHLPPPPGWPRLEAIAAHSECGCQMMDRGAAESPDFAVQGTATGPEPT